MASNALCSLKLEIPCVYECISIARTVTTQLCKIIGFNQHEEFKLQLAVDEACTNIIDVSMRDQAASGKIEINFAHIDEGLEVIIRDYGCGFDVGKIKAPDFIAQEEIIKEEGRGIFLMSQLMDFFEITSSTAGTQVKFRKNLNRKVEFDGIKG